MVPTPRRAHPPLPAIFLAVSLVCHPLVARANRMPPGAPTSACDFHGARTLEALRIFQGSNPVPFVFACGEQRPAGTCVSDTLKPGSPSFPATTVIGLDHTLATWSCVFADGVSGWVPSDRLTPIPDTPAIPIAAWLGWWRNGPDSPGIRNDRLLLTHSPTNSRVIHVSGKAYWHGINGNVHFGGINADALAKGPYLHIVDGTDDNSACILDLTFTPAGHTFTTVDNSQCGGANVRFSGTWNRFTPRSIHSGQPSKTVAKQPTLAQTSSPDR